MFACLWSRDTMPNERLDEHQTSEGLGRSLPGTSESRYCIVNLRCFYNVLHHPQFAHPDPNFASPTFGIISSAAQQHKNPCHISQRANRRARSLSPKSNVTPITRGHVNHSKP